jgi:hypothetical protein
MNREIVRPVATPLPKTREEFLALRKSEPVRTLNDYVDEITEKLYDNDEFRRFSEAVYDEDAVEGSLSIDNAKLAEMIRQYAVENNIPAVSSKKLATIVKALNVVMRRYGLSRMQRKNLLHGEVVDGNGQES